MIISSESNNDCVIHAILVNLYVNALSLTPTLV